MSLVNVVNWCRINRSCLGFLRHTVDATAYRYFSFYQLNTPGVAVGNQRRKTLVKMTTRE